MSRCFAESFGENTSTRRDMANDQHHYPSHLFTIRLWEEALGDDQQEYRGKVQHVESGDARHFRDWATLQAFLLEKFETPVKHSFQTNTRHEGNDGN